jgi:hypothetical protein
VPDRVVEYLARHGIELQPRGEATDSAELERQEVEELMRPYFWFQSGRVETTAYQWEERLALIHRMVSPVRGAELHGIAVECFEERLSFGSLPTK